jgi:uncharacterized protein (TIGR00255 family)
MTGFSRAVARAEGYEIELEIRSVNHRYLTLRFNLSDPLSRYEAQIERMVRQHVRRGTVTVKIQTRRRSPMPDARRLRARAQSFRQLLRGIQHSLGDRTPITLGTLASIPAFWTGLDDAAPDPERLWPVVEATARRALAALAREKAREGRMTRAEVGRCLRRIERLGRRIEQRAPRVIQAYQTRLKARIDAALQAQGVNGGGVELAKEIGIFADRCDITEELSRLSFHQQRMKETLGAREPIGRKLEFMAQEMTREANTLGSKANDAHISSLAVEIKGEVEKIKEQAENLE